MTFLSPAFMFVFLPIALAVYAMAPKFRRIDLLPIISTVFFVCVNIHDLISLAYYFAMALSLVVALSFYKKTKKRAWLIGLELASALVASGLIFYRLMTSYDTPYHAGLVMCFLSIISFCSDVLKEEGRVPDSPWEALIYITFFPTSLIGPFVRYGDFVQKLDHIEFSHGNFVCGATRFVIGFVKCVAISSVLGQAYDKIDNAGASFGLMVFLLIAVIISISIYTFFSGYSDMARGVALMFGIDIEKDFRNPFVNATPADYVRRFFRGFSVFCKLYIADPIDNVFSKGVFGRLVSCVLVGSFYVFILCNSAESALILLVPACIISYFVMFRGKNKKIRLSKWLKLPFGVLTFATMMLVWVLFNTRNLADTEDLIRELASNGAFYAPYEVLAELTNLKYLLVPLISAVVVFFSSRILECEKKGSDTDYTRHQMIQKTISAMVLLALFLLCVVLLLPQFPELTEFEAIGFHFI